MDNKLNNLGLAYAAKKILLGEEVANQIDRVKLLIIANDISEKSKERLMKKCYFYKIDYIDEYSCEEISKAIGKNNIKTIGITDEGFKKILTK